MIDDGIISNALIFHPPFMEWRLGKPPQDFWKAPFEIPMGKSGISKGEWTYKKAEYNSAQSARTVKVSGTAFPRWNDSSGNPIKASHVVSGSQIYDHALREWTSGKLTIDTTIENTNKDKTISTKKGTIVLTLERVLNGQ